MHGMLAALVPFGTLSCYVKSNTRCRPMLSFSNTLEVFELCESLNAVGAVLDVHKLLENRKASPESKIAALEALGQISKASGAIGVHGVLLGCRPLSASAPSTPRAGQKSLQVQRSHAPKCGGLCVVLAPRKFRLSGVRDPRLR